MAGPTITFDADECQALLDLIDRLYVAATTVDPNVLGTDEEEMALSKLREGGKFYVR